MPTPPPCRRALARRSVAATGDPSPDAGRGGPRALATLVLGLFAAGCDPLASPAPLRLEIRLDVQALAGMTDHLVSVVDSALITASVSDVVVDRAVVHLQPGAGPVPVEMTVEAGPVRFDAVVFSNNGTAILAGSTPVTIRDDGFTVALDPVPIRPILAVGPVSSIVAPGIGEATIDVANLGIDELSWSASGLTPPLDSCTDPAGAPVPCLQLLPGAGAVPAGGSTAVVVRGARTASRLFTVDFGSAVGGVRVDVEVGPVPGVVILPRDTLVLDLGKRVRFEAWGVDGAGNRVVVGLDWSTGDPSIASVDAAGLVTARGFGTTQVSATAPGGARGVATLDVLDPGAAGEEIAGRFACALSNYVVGAGLFGDELADAQSSEDFWDFDRRTMRGDGIANRLGCEDPSGGVRLPLIRTIDLADALLALDPAPPADVRAAAAVYAGYSKVLLGEGMCSPWEDLPPQAAWVEALSDFDRAMALQQDDPELSFMALLGSARARIDLGDVAGAEVYAAQALGFGVDVEVLARYDGRRPRGINDVYDRVNRAGDFTIEDDFRRLTFQGVADPRVPIRDTGGPGTDGVTRLWIQDLYRSPTAPIPIATSTEAILILAESALRGGDTAGALGIINYLHARAGLPPLDASGFQQTLDHLAQEYQRELFLQGQHLGLKRRLRLPFTPPAGTPFKGGGSYGQATCFPLIG